MGRADGRGGTTAVDPLELAFARAEREIVRASELASRARSAQTKAAKLEKDYAEAWLTELLRRAEEEGLSWCTYCNKAASKRTLKDVFSAYWKTDHYDPEPHFREITWYRACGQCRKKGGLMQANEHDSYIAKHRPMFGPKDRRNDKPNEQAIENLLKRIEMPAAPAALRTRR
jgi:hypothetical protein